MVESSVNMDFRWVWEKYDDINGFYALRYDFLANEVHNHEWMLLE